MWDNLFKKQICNYVLVKGLPSYVWWLKIDVIMYLLQYIRVLPEGAQCQEDGPFFPTTPRYVIQNGLSINQDILKAPDWIVILCIMVAVLLVMALLIIALVSLYMYYFLKNCIST